MRTVLITGTNRGLGAALAETFAADNCGIVYHSRNPFERSLEYYGTTLEIVYGDLRSGKTLYDLTKAAEKHSVSILVNNAAIYSCEPFANMSETTFRDVLETNLIAPVLLTKVLWPLLCNMQGYVVNINSLAGVQGGRGEVAYCVSKHGLTGFSRALQFDGTANNVKVFDVHVGAMKTDMSKQRQDWDKYIDPYEVAKVVVGLCKSQRTLRTTEITLARGNY